MQRCSTSVLSLIHIFAGIPSIVYGFFGMVVIAPVVLDVAKACGANISSGATILSASILLGIMILPTIIGVSEAALRAVPNSYYEGAVAMGFWGSSPSLWTSSISS